MNGIQDTLPQALSQARSILIDPASNPTAALVLLAILLVALSLLVVAVTVPVLLLRRLRSGQVGEVTPSDESDSETDVETTRNGTRAAVSLGVILLLLLGALAVVALNYTSTTAFCSNCHYTERARESHTEGAHAFVECRSCHEAGGVAAYVGAKARGASNALAQASGDASEGPVPSVVADGACLNCHEDVQEGVLTARSIRVRHSDILSAGYRCIECHNTEGHGKDVARPQYPEMKYCIVCHDGSTASAACDTCHPEDTGTPPREDASRRPRRVIPRTTILKEDCRGCHSMKPCIDCHGIELPHSRDFVAGYHAPFAFDDLDMCLSCHDLYGFCNDPSCHNFAAGLTTADGLRRNGWQHGADFRKTHARRTADKCAGCHSDPDVCRYCHGDVPDH